MLAVVQRVRRGTVEIGDETVASIGCGLVILLGVGRDDLETDANYLADKIAGLRIFEDGEGKMNLSLADTGGAVLVVSQFTLYGDCRKGRRPGFTAAAGPKKGDSLYGKFVERMRSRGVAVQTGRFGAKMLVTIENDGPVTLILESRGGPGPG